MEFTGKLLLRLVDGFLQSSSGFQVPLYWDPHFYFTWRLLHCGQKITREAEVMQRLEVCGVL